MLLSEVRKVGVIDLVADIDDAVMFTLQDRTGKGSAIGRDALVNEVQILVDRPDNKGLSDRAVRNAIERLRQTRRGCLIMSSSGWAGYWLAENTTEIEELYQEERNRALSLMTRLRTQRDHARQRFITEPQMEMFK